MKQQAIGLLVMTALAAGCATQANDTTRRGSFEVTRGEAVKAFADGVMGHCLPAIHRGESFADFEIKGVTPLAALADNRTSLFSDSRQPVYQLVNGVVQIQMRPFTSCQTLSFDLPVKATFDLVGNAVLQTDYDYREEDTGYPQENGELRRVFVSRDGADTVRVTLSGNTPESEANKSGYSTLNATVARMSRAQES